MARDLLSCGLAWGLLVSQGNPLASLEGWSFGVVAVIQGKTAFEYPDHSGGGPFLPSALVETSREVALGEFCVGEGGK